MTGLTIAVIVAGAAAATKGFLALLAYLEK